MNDALSKLIKICRMFGSEHAGERAAAAAQAEMIRKKLGLDWADLLSGKVEVESPPKLNPMSMPLGVLAGAFENVLSTWELDFLKSVAGRTHHSAKQRDVITRVRKKCADYWSGQEARRHAA